jgi:hypothetical protein
MRTTSLLLALLVALALAACGGGDGEPGGTERALSIEEALEDDSGEPLRVSGNLLVSGGETRLCYALAESFPPQCGGPSLAVTGLDPDDVEGLVVEGEVMWTDRPVVLVGTVSGETLAVSENDGT